MIYWSTDTWMTSRKTCFLCFVLFCAVFKMFVRLFRATAGESHEKNLSRAIYKEEKWGKGEKKSSLQLKNT